MSFWALLDFRIQFNELLNSVTDKNENKNPYTEVNTCTINDFLFTVSNLKYNETTRFQKKKKKKKFCIPLPDLPIENDHDPNYFFIETNGFFLVPKFIFCS